MRPSKLVQASAYVLNAVCLEADTSGFSSSGRPLIVRFKLRFLKKYQTEERIPHKEAHKKINDISIITKFVTPFGVKDNIPCKSRASISGTKRLRLLVMLITISITKVF